MEDSDEANKFNAVNMESEGVLTSDKCLEADLHAVGLDGFFWSKVFKDELDVTETKQLEYLDEKDFQLIKKHTRFRWEEKALQKLQGNSKPEKLEIEAKPEKEKSDSIEFEKLFALPNVCLIQDKTQNMAQELESTLTHLEDARSTCMRHERPLKDSVQALMKSCSINNESKGAPFMPISDEEVLKTASGGLALQGIFKTGKVEDLLKDRQQLIQADTYKFAGPRHNSHYMKYEFSDHKSHQTFLASVEKLGCSYSTELGFSVVSKFGLHKTSLSSLSSSFQTQSEQSYIAMMVCDYMPLASAFIDQPTLSDSAKIELLEISRLLDTTNQDENLPQLNERVERFFERFGSHVSQGPIHFGGTFWWNAYAEGFSNQTHNEVKDQVNELLTMNLTVNPIRTQAFIGASHDSSRGKGTSKMSFNDQISTFIKLSVDKFGGPPEIDDNILWKNKLATNNKTWAVIDRGSTLTPVWEIIRTCHKDEFKDPLRLCTLLIAVYKKVTNQEVESADNIKALRAVAEAEKMMQSVNEWLLTDAEKHLRDLLQIKRQIKEGTKSFKSWTDICLSNEALQKFLTNVTTTNAYDNLRFLTQLVMETHCYEVETFPNREQILKWVRGPSEMTQNVNCIFTHIQQFSDVKMVLEKASEDISEENKNVTTCKITHAINSWLKTINMSGLNDLFLVVQSIIKLVGYRDDTFHPLLGSQDIDFLMKELADVEMKYGRLQQDSTLKAQAFSLLTVLTATYKSHKTSEDKRIYFDTFKQSMKRDMNPDLRQVIADFSNHVNWEILEKQLQSMICDTLVPEGNSPSIGILEHREVEDISKEQDAESEDGFSKQNIGLVSPYKDLFERLDLLKCYPSNMPNSNLHNINTLSSSNQIVTEKNLWLHFIYKLLTLDINVRFLHIEPTLQVSCKSLPRTLESFCNFETENDDSENHQETHIHPMDVYMAIYHCSNDFVRQVIFTQLIKCHFAVPLLVPNLSSQQIELPMWPLQISAPSLQTTEQSAVQKQSAGCVLDIPLPVVAFMRLGTSRNSKSKMINDIMYKNGHPTFFSRHCRGSTATRVLLEGVAEMSWYLPEGKTSDIFESCVTFINLHGDACKHTQQVQFLTELSSVIVLLLPEILEDSEIQESINYFLESKIPFIALFSGMETIDKGDLNRIAAKNRNEADLAQEIIFKMKKSLSKENRKQILKNQFEQGKLFKFTVNKEIELKGKEHAKLLMDILNCEHRTKDKKSSGLKDVHLPLQGNLWMQWCIKDKEFHRIQCKKNMSIEQQRAEIAEEKKKIRVKQQEISENKFMETFLQYAVDVDENERSYFLNWLKKCLNENLRGNLVNLSKQYNTTWLKYRETSAEEREKHPNDLCELSKRIKNATFDLQHVFREISQIYESHRFVDKSKTINGIELDKLPEMGVDLMLSGHPIELMDGDVNYVAIEWVSAVLKKLNEKLGNKRVLVLSVVGLQSSGKSTLLNAMFGLDFAVSSGPCTRGAFMHLIPVDEGMRDKMSFDYVLVVDTEGLRSTVTDPDVVVRNDNELATLIIGISDITLINVMGENLCEIQNILQVCFLAFLRMKNVNIHPSCIFVHQNVSDIAAREKNEESRRQLIEKLDEIAKAAAEQENQKVNAFSEIINFDVNRDVLYFKNLFEGDPPMAPPNPSYSQNVQGLKKRVLSVSTWRPNSRLLTLSEVSDRIKDTWNALLNENFIFNFRNSLAMKVYNDLEREHQRWSWQLRKIALDTQRALNCRVKSGELSRIDKFEVKLIFENTHKDIKTDVDKYFKGENYSDILSQWRDLIDRSLETLKEEMTEETYQKGLKDVHNRDLKLELESQMEKYEADLLQLAITAASALRDQSPSEERIQEEFNKLWIQWTTDLSSKNPKEAETNIQSVVERALLTHFEKHKDVVCIKSEEVFLFDAKKHVKQWFHVPLFQRNNSQINQTGNDISKSILLDIDEKIKKKAADGDEITENFIHQILEEIKQMILNYEKSSGFQFTSFFKAELSAHVCKISIKKFRKINENFRHENDPLTHLLKKKQYFFQLYKDFCQGVEMANTFVSVFTQCLQEVIHYAFFDKLSVDIADYLRRNHKAFKGNKSDLEHHIMKHLAEQENFEEYMEYIIEPKSFCRTFIRKCVVKHISEESVLGALSSSWSQLTENILIKCSFASEKMKETQGNASVWLDDFCSKVGEQFPLSRRDFRTIENLHIDNAQILQEKIASSLKDMLKKGKDDPRRLLESGSYIVKEKTVDILFDQMGGCWEQCPFCRAVCSHTISDHKEKHSAAWHRSQALGGFFHQRKHNILAKFFLGSQDEGVGTEKHFVLDSCSTSVISNNEFQKQSNWIPFQHYRNAGPPHSEWDIRSDNDDKLYWKWFICTFSKELEMQYGLKFEGFGKIPENWKQIGKHRVLQEIDGFIQSN